MKIAVSFLSSKHSFLETIKKINESSALYIHTDIMDGKYVENKSFDKDKIKYLSKFSNKNCDVHLMTNKPSKYLKYFKSNIFNIIYFHPKTEKNNEKFIKKIKKLNKEVGIVINPDERISDYKDIYKLIDYVLLMSVTPGAGGQKFILDTPKRLDELNKLIKKNKYNIKIAVDGGINNKTIKLINDKNIEYAVSGSYICNSNDFEKKLKAFK